MLGGSKDLRKREFGVEGRVGKRFEFGISLVC